MESNTNYCKWTIKYLVRVTQHYLFQIWFLSIQLESSNNLNLVQIINPKFTCLHVFQPKHLPANGISTTWVVKWLLLDLKSMESKNLNNIHSVWMQPNSSKCYSNFNYRLVELIDTLKLNQLKLWQTDNITFWITSTRIVERFLEWFIWHNGDTLRGGSSRSMKSNEKSKVKLKSNMCYTQINEHTKMSSNLLMPAFVSAQCWISNGWSWCVYWKWRVQWLHC